MSVNPRLTELETSGERFVPEAMSGSIIDAEHQARYRFAMPQVRDRVVLDAGCGVGWGSALMLEAGASEVTGVDIAPDAVADARQRVPAATFLVGDLMHLPIADDSSDVVVCFEALEHTTDTARTLDELARVLRPGGLLFVSSPNPAVYPAGNPFHFHEMPPTELLHACAERFAHVRLFRQHLLIASLLDEDFSSRAERQQIEATSFAISPLAEGHDPYSVVIASDRELPDVIGCQTLAPATQLQNLGALASALAEERELLHTDQSRILVEREELLAAQVTAQRDLVELGDAYRAIEQRLREAGETIGELMLEHDNARQQLTSLEQAHETVARIQRELRQATSDRDRFSSALVDSEQALARHRESARQVLTALQLAERELATVRQSTSWRATAPLRQLAKGRPAKGRARDRRDTDVGGR